MIVNGTAGRSDMSVMIARYLPLPPFAAATRLPVVSAPARRAGDDGSSERGTWRYD